MFQTLYAGTLVMLEARIYKRYDCLKGGSRLAIKEELRALGSDLCYRPRASLVTGFYSK
jgi:hypothetical protein